MSRLGVGVVGIGFIGRVHVDAIRRIPEANVIAVSECNEELARARAASLGVERAYGDYRALLEDRDVQVVHVCTPNRTHYEIVSAALEAGKHVVAEKPLAMVYAEAADLRARAERAGAVNAVNFMNRGYPMIQHARGLIASGAIGEVRLVHGSYLQDWLLRDTDWNWRVEESEGGSSRALADIGSHWLDLVQTVAGASITHVFAEMATIHPVRYCTGDTVETFNGSWDCQRKGVAKAVCTEDYASVLLRLANGARGALTVSQVSAGRKNRLWFEIDGSEASLAWDSEQPEYLWLGRRGEPSQILQRDPAQLLALACDYTRMPGGHAEAWPDAQRNVLTDVYRNVLEAAASDDRRYATFADGAQAIRIVEAALASARRGAWVDVSVDTKE